MGATTVSEASSEVGKGGEQSFGEPLTQRPRAFGSGRLTESRRHASRAWTPQMYAARRRFAYPVIKLHPISCQVLQEAAPFVFICGRHFLSAVV